MEPITVVLAASAVWYLLSRQKSFAFQPVTGGVTKKPWLTRVVGISGSGDNKKTMVELWAPAGSWGPHGNVLVVTYEQTGDNKGSRRSLGVGPEAVPAMVTAAGQDFGIQTVPATVAGLISGAAADDKFPIYDPRTKRKIGSGQTYHAGSRWYWIAKYNNGTPIAQGKSLTPALARAHAHATTNRRFQSDRRRVAIMRNLRA